MTTRERWIWFLIAIAAALALLFIAKTLGA